MITKIITEIQNNMKPYLNQYQSTKLTKILLKSLNNVEIS
jgi:hypothetical protein